jgi:large subunit ribosomal protein L24e
MVVKTELCAFSDARIYPGHGMRFIKRDGTTMYFSGSKTKRLYNSGVKSSKLTWTMAWRKLHKKDKREEGSKQRKRRVVRVQRSYVGLTAEDIAKKKAEPPKVRQAAREAALKEAKDRVAKEKAAKAAIAKKTASNAPVQGKTQKGSHQTKGR